LHEVQYLYTVSTDLLYNYILAQIYNSIIDEFVYVSHRHMIALLTSLYISMSQFLLIGCLSPVRHCWMLNVHFNSKKDNNFIDVSQQGSMRLF
jgi:hypothetical protein